MAAYRMTAARRAALKKAQAASARKRRKGGTRKKGRVRSYAKRVSTAQSKKQAYSKKHYSGAGGIYRMNSDRYHSRGAFSTGISGKKYGKKGKRVNKGAQVILASQGINPIILGVSRHRNKKRKKR